MGGTGKTSLIKYLIEKLKDKKKFIVVIKGYGKEKDEIKLLKKNFPDLEIYEDKSLKGLREIDGRYEIVLIDDGFHCIWIKKNLEILLIDCLNPFDNNFLIPAGLLREPKSSVKRSNIIVLTHSQFVESKKLKKITKYLERFNKPIFVMNYKFLNIKNNKEEKPLDFVKNKKILAFAGIGNPLNFVMSISILNPSKVHFFLFPDHYSYKSKDIQEIESIYFKNNLDLVLTTEKDFVKIEKFEFSIPIYFLSYVLEIKENDKENFDKIIEKCLNNNMEDRNG